ncbi:thymidylate synthase [Tardiphaga sp. 1201_B9_N1_1]|uniref:thymidylate synthase n=1 Tax=unclassified Tardiphaga TaxID=2631404 RepID=UPI003F1EB760
MIKPSACSFVVERESLSLAWGEVFLRLLSSGVTEISPLSICITGFSDDGNPVESADIRERLDALLEEKEVTIDTETVAFTIFPQEYWELANKSRAEFFSLYRESFTRIQDWKPRHNKRGSYFQRLVDYEGNDEGHNQLDWILKEYTRNPTQRISQFQATTFNPLLDHSRTAQLEFPCLQHVSFVPMHDGTLTMNAFYATQQIFRKGYGNYLGLCRLGAFMAGEMDLKLSRVCINVGVAKMDVPKTDPLVQQFAEYIKHALSVADESKKAA